MAGDGDKGSCGPKFCRDCRYLHKHDWHLHRLPSDAVEVIVQSTARCTHPKATTVYGPDLVTGVVENPLYAQADGIRGHDEFCGKAGKWFEPRTEGEPEPSAEPAPAPPEPAAEAPITWSAWFRGWYPW